MTNLPITTTAPQAAATSQQPTSNGGAGDTENSQPFGTVLAKQINGPAAKDVKANGKEAKAGDQNAADILAQLGADPAAAIKDALDIKKDAATLKTGAGDAKKPDVTITDGATTLPADMLAAMLAHAMSAAAAAPATAPGAKSASPAIDAGSARDQRGLAATKTEASATLPAALAPQASAAAIADARSEGQSFAAVREAVTAAAAGPQSNAAALAAMQNNAASIAAPAVLPVQVTVNTPVKQEQWGDEFSQKITWLASSKLDQTAELHLNPPQLGPVDVVIKVSGDQATALFTSPHAAVREAIEQAMPKLRDMLADNGITLGNTTVSDQAPRDQGQPNGQRPASARENDIRDSATPGNSTVRVSPITRHNGIVDTFA